MGITGHHVAVVDLDGRLDATAFPAAAAGYAQLISWLQSHGEVERGPQWHPADR